MYEKFYGFDVRPFELTPDPEFFFLGESHKEGLAFLKYGALAGKELLMLTGGVGTGKSTLIGVLLEHVENRRYCCVINNPTLAIDDFFALLASQLGIDYSGKKADFLLSFSKLLERCQDEKERVVLVLDEAHCLSVELFQEVRFLLNLAIEYRDVLTIFLIGQPELLDLLTEKSLEAFRQRVTTRCHLASLTEKETVQYIMFRMSRAGGTGENIFTRSALKLVYEASRGNPRLVNIICDNALLSGYASETRPIDEDIIHGVVEQLRIPGEKDIFYLRPRGGKKKLAGFIGAAVVFLGIVAGCIAYWFY